jgi:HAD superfamily hydrolase (TIGR01509 family)
MMQAAIFDMDGTLIDSEPMWKEAEKQVFSSVGVEVTNEHSSQTASMTTREVTEFWYHLYPWSGKSLDQVENEVVDRVAKLISLEGTPMEGVIDVLEFFHEKKFKIGLSTNAPSRLIPLVLEKLNIAHYFHAISSSENEVNGKPDPAVYLSTAKKLKLEPSKCIAFEDSISGVISATRANMKTVVVPPILEFWDEKYEMSDFKLKHLSEFSDVHLEKIVNTSR